MESALCYILVSRFVSYGYISCYIFSSPSATVFMCYILFSNLLGTLPLVPRTANGNGQFYICLDISIYNYLAWAMSSVILRRPKPLCYIHRFNPKSDIYRGLTPHRTLPKLFIVQNLYWSTLLSYPTFTSLNHLYSLTPLAMNFSPFHFRVPECS